MTIEVKDKIQALIDVLVRHNIDAFVQPTQDCFLSEYPPHCAKRLEWLTGFDGSAGAALILKELVEGKPALLFTDGRYTLQASQQLDSTLFHVIDSADESPVSWLKKHQPDAVLGFDPWLHPHQQVSKWTGLQLKPVSPNPVDALWKNRSAQPSGAPHAHPVAYAGKESKDKIAELASALHTDAAAAFLTMPDGINWLLNIRGDDIPYNPLALCYALVTREGAVSIISETPSAWQSYINDKAIQECIVLQDFLKQPDQFFKSVQSMQCDPGVTPEAIWQAAEKAGCRVINADDPTLLPKAIKNATEMDGMRKAHEIDGRALTRFLEWLDAQESWSELEAAEKLSQFRRHELDETAGEYKGPSFETISGAGPHGAIVHYRVTDQSNRPIQDCELYLVDSGGQYLYGTTDVTRTVVHGTPTAEMIDRYTRVLKGHIALAMAVFPKGTSGGQLDVLARQYLWEVGLDFAHGTGHGVGSYLCVHEGPQRIGKRGGDVPLQAGMILSNEPGYYKAGEYGIRIENLVLVREAEREGYLCFETLTLAPLDERLIDAAMLTEAEQAWLDTYHERVRENMRVKPFA